MGLAKLDKFRRFGRGTPARRINGYCKTWWLRYELGSRLDGWGPT